MPAETRAVVDQNNPGRNSGGDDGTQRGSDRVAATDDAIEQSQEGGASFGTAFE
jgi:hypothetical protein